MITFGICTDYQDLYRLRMMVASIDAQHIPHYEIILMGGGNPWQHSIPSVGHLKQIPCAHWIPVKKNWIAFESHFETIVMCHDYFEFAPHWYQEYIAYGWDWDVCSNPQRLSDGSRHATDWITWDDPFYGRYYSLPYQDITRTKYQYISGGYFLVKRDFMRKHPFNESMKPGEPEDVEWSLRIRDEANIRCNPNSYVKHNKIHRDVGNKAFPLFHVSHLSNNKHNQ